MTDTVRPQVDARVQRAMEQAATDLAPIGAAAEDLLGPLSTLGARGKRMRATLLVAAHRAAGGARIDAAIAAASALELFQTAALIHDDVLDRSDTRRGLPATHRAIESLHRQQSLAGDAERFGINGAILAGDLALMAALGEIADAVAAIPDAVGAEVGRRFRTMASLCTAGQYLDVKLAEYPVDRIGDLAGDIESVMRSKTASYTTEAPLALGAALAGLPRAEVDAWAAAGVPLGLAFQLRDDLLGVVGDPTVTGKPAGDDLREGKATLVLSDALRLASVEQRDAILAVCGEPDATDEQLARATDAVRASGAVEAAERRIAAYRDDAEAALSRVSMSSNGADELMGLVSRLVQREA